MTTLANSKQQTLLSLKQQLAAKINPADIDFGYCIPDCGNCCPNIFAGAGELENICGKLGVESDSAAKDKDSSDRCIFIYSHRLCVIHDLEERNHICRSFRCSYYVLNKSLTKKLGLDIPSELKKMWLERLGNGYDREKWITEAVTHLMKAGDRLTKTYMLAEMMTE